MARHGALAALLLLLVSAHVPRGGHARDSEAESPAAGAGLGIPRQAAGTTHIKRSLLQSGDAFQVR